MFDMYIKMYPTDVWPASLYNLMHIYRIPPAYRQNILDGYNSGLVSITAKFNVTIVNVLPCVFHLCDTCIFSKRIQ